MKNIVAISRFLLSVLMLVFLSVQSLMAQSIFTNPINNGAPNSFNPYTLDQVVNANITVSGIGRGPGIAGNAGASRYNANNWGASFDASDYFTFVITPNSGYQINFVSFVYTSQYSGTGPKNFAIRSSADNFTSNIYSSTSTSGTVSLSAAAFQGVTSAIEFRFYAWGSTSAAGTFSINDFTFNGTVTGSAAPPTLTGPSVTDVSDTGARYNVTLSSNGGSTITERGFVWSTSSNPVIGGAGVTKVVVSGTAVGAFNELLTTLPPATRIYFKGYAANSSGTGYSSEVSFYTLAAEPDPASTFTATTQSKNSIRLDWSQVNQASGYLIIQRPYLPPTGVPSDATEYAANQGLGDGTVAGWITSGSTTTYTVTGLLQGTRYHYTLFPYNYNGVNRETYNFYTALPVAAATDSTWGRPTSLSSTVVSALGEAVSIPSIQNETVAAIMDGKQVWSLHLSDGGATMDDDDDLPTVLTYLRLRAGTGNTISNWSTAIESAGLFDDSTGNLLATGTVTANTVVFSGFNVAAADDNYRPLSVRLSLEKRVHVDKSGFHFQINQADITTEGLLTSSQKTNFTDTTDRTKNKIEVTATQLRFINQPPASVEAGNPLSITIQTEALDTFGARDIDYTGTVFLRTAGGNLMYSPRGQAAIAGVASFDTLRFFQRYSDDTLVAEVNGFYSAYSQSFDVVNSSRSDIVADASFTYPQLINPLNYNHSSPLSPANSLEVGRFVVRDGGAGGDMDFAPTRLDSLVLDVEAAYLIDRAALYQGTTLLAQTDSVYINGLRSSLHFGQIQLSAADNDSARFGLYITFRDSARDQEQLTFKISETYTSPLYSGMARTDAGGAITNTDGNNNRVDVIATELRFDVQPGDITRGSIRRPAVEVIATDARGNQDMAARNVQVYVTGSRFAPSSILQSTTGNDGQARFSRLIFNQVSGLVYLRAQSAGLDSAISDTFIVRIPYQYRSVASGNWSDIAIWEYSANYGNTWQPATEAPNYDQHGLVHIMNGDTVQMDGTSQEENTVDELIVEAGGVLITPQGNSSRMKINDSDSLDMVILGELRHQNGQSLGGILFDGAADVRVLQGGLIRLDAFGSAMDWAGNTAIFFDSGAVYSHNTSLAGTLSPGLMFPNAGNGNIPVFRVNASATYPDNLVPAGAILKIQGLLEIVAGAGLVLDESAVVDVRDGLSGDGDLILGNRAEFHLSGADARVEGNGAVQLNGNSRFVTDGGSKVTLLSNKPLSTSQQSALGIKGIFDGQIFGWNGSPTVFTDSLAVLVTAHQQGLNGLFGNGNKQFSPATGYQFNGTQAQITGLIPVGRAAYLLVNNAAGIELSHSLTLADTLYLQNGVIKTSPSAVLKMERNRAILNHSASRFVEGPLAQWVVAGDSAYFPIGDAGNFGSLQYHTTRDQWVKAEYLARNPGTDGYATNRLGGFLKQINQTEYWKLDAQGGQVRMTLTSLTNIGTVVPEDIRVAGWNGQNWMAQGPGRRNASLTEVFSDGLTQTGVITLALDSSCVVPGLAQTGAGLTCQGDQLVLQASGASEIHWFTALTDETPFRTGMTVTLTPVSMDTVFYVQLRDKACYGPKTAYPVTLQARPAAPVVSGKQQICYGQETELNVSTNAALQWFADALATQLISTADSLYLTRLQKDTTIYVREVVQGCPGDLKPVYLKVKQPVDEPQTWLTRVCPDQAAELRAQSPYTLEWYTDSLGGAPVWKGSRFVLPQVGRDTFLYVAAMDADNCPSERIRAEVKVFNRPAAPVSTTSEICEGQDRVLNATATGTIYWYDQINSTHILDTGNTFRTPVLFGDKTYYAATSDGQCFSARTAVEVLVRNYPQSFTIQVPQGVRAGQAVTISTTAQAANYAWSFGPDATPATVTGAGPHNIIWKDRGPKTVNLRVWNDGAGNCSLETQQLVIVDAGLGFGNETVEMMKLYPNPVSSGEIVQIETTGPEFTGIQIYDSFGRLVREQKGDRFSTEGLVPGVYVILMETDQQQLKAKLIVR